MIIDHIYARARSEPTKLALIYNDAKVDYITFAKCIEASRNLLRSHDLQAGTIAVVLAANLAESWVLVFALRSLGLTTIHARSLVQAQDLGIKNVSCVVTTAPEQSVHGLAANPIAGAKLVVVQMLDFAATPLGDSPPQGDRPSGGHILYTSGTTGAFKKLMWDGDLEEARTAARSRVQGFDSRTVAHILHYEQHTGIGWKIPLAVWQAGGCAVFDQRPERYERFFSHGITSARLVADAFQQLVDADNAKPDASLSQCVLWLTGGLIAAESIAKAIAKYGEAVSIYNDHTATELATGALTSTRIRNPDDGPWLEPAADRTVQIVDEDDNECSPGQDGYLRILLTGLDWQGYLDDEEATSAVFRDGFFYPGDWAVRRFDGRIRILGRIADVINVQGTKLAVAPIEQQIRQFLQVNAVCMFSGPNEAGQNELVIALETDSEPPKEKLDAISRGIQGFEKIRYSVLSKFPRTEMGAEKVRRNALRKLLFS